jgi:NADH-quinone oxidoreductase subunit J
VFELSAALLIVAAVGRDAAGARPAGDARSKGQPELAADRMLRLQATKGEHPGSLPNSGVYAGTQRHRRPGAAARTAAVVGEVDQPDARACAAPSIDPAAAHAGHRCSTFAAIEAVRDEDEED